ncbi:TSC22 domain family protein 2 isoform X1 [Ursus maritimus]|uniref:TSC22 domain family protein 2 isoform X1 n=1 Tax=Ursus maritimus TaxID=29073 RepID=A0A8M1GD40_URSMA|nr:TSC22 domain family protein 2 isoform X1 [Ursus arctos]XP_040492612.1 TSC22 domain family protein 2 isoform X1 [Ursus maritimus]
MSKMPAKKKSCFQITSVTTAQVATSITEDTESLDDPDESRTEDVSSEIFDVSRATDYGPEEVCERSSSEETLNNVGDAETPGTVSPNLLLDGQLAAAAAAPANGGGAVSARSVAGAVASTLAAAATSAPSSGAPGAAPVAGSSAGPGTAAPSQPPTTCSSRFRVIKLDHGSGEPYRRGRWTCMEYYERDSDSSVLTRSGDCIRHSNTFDQTAERDSGLGATGGSVVVVVASMQGAHGPDSGTDSSLTAVSQLPPSEKMSQPAPAQPQSFGVGQPQPPPPVGGAVVQSAAPVPPFPAAAAGPQQMMAAPQPSQLQGTGSGVLPQGPNGQGLPLTNVTLTQPGVPLPPQPGPAVGAPATQQPQPFAYPQPQLPPGHLLPVQPAGQSEYLQQHVAGLQPPSPAQPSSAGAAASLATAASLPVGTGQNASSVGAQIMGVSSLPSEAVAPGPGPAPGGQAAPGQPAGVPLAAVGCAVPPGLVPPGTGQPQSVPPPQMGGSGAPSAVPGGPHAVLPGVPNVPAAVPAPSVPSVSTTSVTMPNVPAPLVQSQQLSSHTPVSRSSSIIQHVGLPVAQGTPSAPTSLPQSDLSQFQTQTQPLVGQVDDTRRKSEPLPQPPLSLIAENKPVVKPPVADALANPLQLTPMNSLATSVFSIAIPVDGDEDRNPSTAFYQAFHLNTFQESKNLWDSASGGGGVAIDNKIEQAMDLVKSHLMYAVREEVEVLKEQIKELVERNSLLERENALLKSLSNNDQLSQLPAQQANPGSTSQQQAVIAQPPQPAQPPQQPNVSSA